MMGLILMGGCLFLKINNMKKLFFIILMAQSVFGQGVPPYLRNPMSTNSAVSVPISSEVPQWNGTSWDFVPINSGALPTTNLIQSLSSTNGYWVYSVTANGNTNGFFVLTNTPANTVYGSIQGSNVVGVMQIYNFKDYASDCTGVNDVSHDLQALINLAPVGSTIYIPRSCSGQWQWTNGIYINKALRFQGVDTDVGTASIRFTGTGAAISTTNDMNGLFINGLKILGSGSSAGQIGLATSSLTTDLSVGFKLRNLYFDAFGRIANLTNFVNGNLDDVQGANSANGIRSIVTSGNAAFPVFLQSGAGNQTATSAFDVNGSAVFIGTDANASKSVYKVSGGNASFISANGEGPLIGMSISNTTTATVMGSRMAVSSYGFEVFDNSTLLLLDNPTSGFGGTLGNINFQVISHQSGMNQVQSAFRRVSGYLWATNDINGMYYPITESFTETANTGLIGSLSSSQNSTNSWGAKWRSIYTGSDHIYEYVKTNTVTGSPKFMLYDHFQYMYDRYVSPILALRSSTNGYTEAQTVVVSGSGVTVPALYLYNTAGGSRPGTSLIFGNSGKPGDAGAEASATIASDYTGPNWASELLFYVNGDANGADAKLMMKMEGTNQTTYIVGTGGISVLSGITSLSSNLLAPSSITIGASPVNWTNTFSKNVAVYVDGVSVTGTVAINGGTIFNTIGQNTVLLEPNEYVTISYTIGTPTAKWKPR